MQPNQANLERLFQKVLLGVENRGGRRSKALGTLVVIGGPGGTGLSSVARNLAKRLGLTYLYAGDILRRFGKENGFEDIEEFVKSEVMQNSQGKFDLAVESEVIENSQKPFMLIDSKVFAALSTVLKIPTSIKIWVIASIDVRTHRIFEKYGLANKNDVLDMQSQEYLLKQQKLVNRQSLDAQRYFDLYGIEYGKPEQYNDIIVDSSNMTLDDTVKHLIIKLKNMGIVNDDVKDVNDMVLTDIKSSVKPVDKVNEVTPEVIEDVAQLDSVYPEDLNERWTSWKCLVCGYTYEGSENLTKCPKCGNEDPDKFD